MARVYVRVDGGHHRQLNRRDPRVRRPGVGCRRGCGEGAGTQGGLKALRALERDSKGRAIRCETETDVKVRTVKSTVRISYDVPTRLRLDQEKGDLKSLRGIWELEAVGGKRTRATYSLEVELGRILGMVIRGPLIDLLRDMLAGARADELKPRIESG